MPDKIKSSWPQHVATHTQCWLTGIFYWKTRHSKLAFDSFMFVTLPYSYYMYIERTMYVHNLIVFIFCFVSVSIRKWPNVYCSIYIYIRYTMATTISSEWCECAKCVSSRSFDTKQQTTEKMCLYHFRMWIIIFFLHFKCLSSAGHLIRPFSWSANNKKKTEKKYLILGRQNFVHH